MLVRYQAISEENAGNIPAHPSLMKSFHICHCSTSLIGVFLSSSQQSMPLGVAVQSEKLLLPGQVWLPQGASRRQGSPRPQEGAAAADLWPLDRHGH